nr:reverse transcriptase domain-containing protein [Tanacetum cinerariifolium]
MRTRSSSNLPVESPPNPSTSNPKRRNRRRSKQPFILKESPVDMMADQHTMAELLCAPTEGYAEAIVVPSILAEQFELKHSLINIMTSDQFFELEKDNPHDHICWFNKITSTIKYKDGPNSVIKLMLFPFSLAGEAHRWLEKEPPHSIRTWEDLVSKFINEFFPPQEQQIFVMKFQNFNNGSGSLPSNTVAIPKGKLKAITNRSGIVLYGLSVPIPPPFINPEDDERVEETLTDQDLAEYTIKDPPLLQMLKALLSNKKKLLKLANTPFNEIAQRNLADLNDNLVDSMPEMFTKEHALDYSSSPLYDEYDDDLFEVESNSENVYDDPFDSKVEKIKESKLLIDELDLPCDFLLPSEYESFFSKDFSEVDALPSTNNKDKIFKPGILI